MEEGVTLYRAVLYDTCPTEKTGGVGVRQSHTMVGFWDDLVGAIGCCYQDYWVEIFDAITDKHLAGPFAPSAQVSDFIRQARPSEAPSGDSTHDTKRRC